MFWLIILFCFPFTFCFFAKALKVFWAQKTLSALGRLRFFSSFFLGISTSKIKKKRKKTLSAPPQNKTFSAPPAVAGWVALGGQFGVFPRMPGLRDFGYVAEIPCLRWQPGCMPVRSCHDTEQPRPASNCRCIARKTDIRLPNKIPKLWRLKRKCDDAKMQQNNRRVRFAHLSNQNTRCGYLLQITL